MLNLGNDSMSCIRVVIPLDPNVLTTRMKYQEMRDEESFPMMQVSGQNSFWKPKNQRMSNSKVLNLGNDSMPIIRVVIPLDPNILTTRMKYREMRGEESFPMVQVSGQNSFWKPRNQRNGVL